MLSGCGFRFRSAVSFPAAMGVTYISTPDRYSPFYRALTTALRRDGIALTDDATLAGTTIRIHRDVTGQRILSVSARNVPREYDVYYTVRYSVLKDGVEVLPEQRLTMTQDYTYDERQVLGKANEEQTLRAAIADDLVGLVARQINSIDGL